MSVDTDQELNTETSDSVMTLTDIALETVLGIRGEEDDPQSLGLRIEITGERGTEYVYDLSFDELTAAEDTDLIDTTGDIAVIVPANTVELLRGAVLDVPNEKSGGLVIRNPNRPAPPKPLAPVDLDLEGSVAEQVQQLLEKSINPSLASHGGFATLVGVDENNAVFVTMGGGCQGCAMSRQTLTEGIAATIKASIAEVTDVVDATDHSEGENPFY